MPPPSLPAELILDITSQVLDERDHYHVSREKHKAARMERLASFRRLARISKDWLDPARVVFWSTVSLFTIHELAAFAIAINGPTAKSGCIESLHIRLPNYIRRDPSIPDFDMTLKARRSLPSALLRLPAHLRVLQVDSNRNWHEYHYVVYDCLEAAYRDQPSWVIDVDTLDIGSRQDRRDVFPMFAFVRNVRHLVLTVDPHDLERTFKSPCPFTQLQSLTLDMQFDEGFYSDVNTWAAIAADGG
jgi:hypothetical protein